MKINDAVEHMTKFYLRRIVGSFTKDFPKPNDERAREIINQNVNELSDPERIERVLSVADKPYSRRILQRNVLASLLNKPERKAKEQEIVNDVIELEKDILEESDDPECLRYEDEKSLEVMRAVLDVAVEDDEISTDELRLISKLQNKLGIQERTKHVLLAQLGHFPRKDNNLHSTSDLKDALTLFQKIGVVFYCNQLNDGAYLIPEEIVPGVKRALDIQLGDKPWQLLLDNLTHEHLNGILEAQGLPKYGVKDEKISRIVHAGIRPIEALNSLGTSELYSILDRLPGANVSGTKPERVQRIIDYFVNRVTKEVPEEASKDEVYYEYLTELGHRDRENLLVNDVISKDKDMDLAFENGVRFLFEEHLDVQHEDVSGSDHPDGILELPGGDFLLWDTKSKEDSYRFPKTHFRQFKRYIRDANERVSCFLIVCPDVEEQAITNAELLKTESGQDTDVALISAEDLKWVAERWKRFSRESEFDLNVFNITGHLNRTKLEQRMELLL